MNSPQSPSASHPVGVVIVTWNSRSYVDECLQSVFNSDVPVTVLVVDNASSDGTAEHILASYPLVSVIASPENSGFAAGVNQGVRALVRDLACTAVFLLNPDATVEADTIGKLAADLEDPNIGIVCPTILYRDRDIVWFDGSVVDLRTGEAPHVGQGSTWLQGTGLVRTGRACGCAMMLRIADFQRLGGMLDELFLYWEDTELSLRFSDAGLETVVDRGATARHAVSASSGGGGSFVYEYYMTRNRMRVMSLRYNWSRSTAAFRRLPRSARHIAKILASGDRSGAYIALRAHYWAYRDYWRGIAGPRHRERM